MSKGKKAKAEATPTDKQPTIDVLLKRGVKAVKMSDLKIVGGESQIHINDVYATMKKMQHLSEREKSLFTLEDFVQVRVVDQSTTSVQT